MAYMFMPEAIAELGLRGRLTGYPETQQEFEVGFEIEVGEELQPFSFSDYSVTWQQLVDKSVEIEAAMPIKILRAERDRRLAASDWMVAADRTATQAQLDYRQALRDVPQNYSSLDDVVWPTKPEN